ncbi:RNA helicase [Maricaulis sp. W15]|uniref:DEAD/DEAH box helicase n=1 Tax=Maricaulis sp. W15 TaxID=1772333 RepID=UPI000948D9B0|nr:DEAD/DEAH box helicase [Maricaulis sp. W15]OLF73088.1 RNA helicase [Maricaulis sp. W15]
MTFAELGLSPKLLEAIEQAGYSEPTPIQAGAIPAALAGKDVLGIAQTGTGKTASFTLPLIERLSRGRAKARMPRSLIIAPTRELAAQCAENFETYSKGQRLSMALLIGGVAFGPQEEILNKGADVLIATPGRLLDHFGRGKLLMTGVQMLVVDEADRMLDMGFIPDLEKIFSLVPPPPRRQTLFFSATMPKEIQSLVDRFLRDPERVEVSRPAQTGANITQLMVRLTDSSAKAKRAALRLAMAREGVRNGIIFSNRKRDVDVVARSLQRHGFSAAPIHGDLDQSARTATLADFKAGTLRFLVASDVAARGLDIPDVSHVFNYDMPHHADDYVHRIGRTGRAGKSGESITIFAPGDEKSLSAVVKLIKQEIPELTLDGLNDASSDVGAGSSGGRSSSGRGSTRKGPESSGRSRRSRSGKSETAEQPPADAQTASAATPSEPVESAKETKPEPAIDNRPPRAKRNTDDASEGHRRSSRKPGQKRERGSDSDRSVVGFGDHVPSFMNADR